MKHRMLRFVTLALVLFAMLAPSAGAAPVLTDGLDYSHKTNVNRFYAGTWPRWAQSFTANTAGTLDSATFWLDHDPGLGSHAGSVSAELWAITGTYGTTSVPTGVPLATSASIEGSKVPDLNPGPLTFEFDNSFMLAEGAQYAIVLHWAFDDGGATCEVARSDVDLAAHPGNQSGYALSYGGTWMTTVPVQADLIFAVYVEPSTADTKLTFSAPSTCAYQSAKASGSLKDADDKPLADKPVRIQYLAAGQWKTVATAITDADGLYKITLTPSQKTTYRAWFEGDDTYSAKTTAGKTVLPKVRLSHIGDWQVLAKGQTYSFKGYIEPKHASSEPKLVVKAYKRRADGSYPALTSPSATFSTGASFTYYSATKTLYSVPVKLSAGTWRLYVFHPTDTRNVVTYWGYDTVVVK